MIQKNLVMMTRAILLMEIGQVTMKAASKKIMKKMTLNKQHKILSTRYWVREFIKA